jgi:hypothetical protein
MVIVALVKKCLLTQAFGRGPESDDRFRLQLMKGDAMNLFPVLKYCKIRGAGSFAALYFRARLTEPNTFAP